MGGSHRFYEEGEAEEILRRAIHQSDSGAIDRQKLLSMASELGISEDAVSRAEAEMASERETQVSRSRDELDRVSFRRHKRSRFFADFASYLSVNGFMIAIWWFSGAGYFWPFWVLAGWGIGLFSDFVNTFFGQSEKDFERWKRRRQKLGSRIEVDEEAVEHFLDGIVPRFKDRKLEVIKEVRKKFGFDLADSKDFVDEYYEKHGVHWS